MPSPKPPKPALEYEPPDCPPDEYPDVTKLAAVTVIVETLEQFLPESQDVILASVHRLIGR